MKMPFALRESFRISVKFLSDMKLLKVMFAFVTVAWASARSPATAVAGTAEHTASMAAASSRTDDRFMVPPFLRWDRSGAFRFARGPSIDLAAQYTESGGN